MKKFITILIAIAITLLVVNEVSAQEDNELKLGLNRDWGYGGLGNDIQGLFTMKIVGPPENLSSVEFMIDDEVVSIDSAPPFSYQFNTDEYALGEHTLSATGVTTDGTKLTSNEIVVEFVPASEGTKFIGKFLVPIIVLLMVAMLATFIIPVLLMRRKGQTLPLGAPRSYGFAGGTICPKCKRPFGMHAMALNVLVGKLDLCPHCGKWSVVRRYSREFLDAAVAAELELAQAQQAITPESEEEKLRKELEDSKYHEV